MESGPKDKDQSEKSPGEIEKLRPRILLAEDDESIVSMLVPFLERMKCEVEHVSNGVLLVEKLSDKGPGYYSLVVTDNNMPGGNGIDAIEQVREMKDFKDIPIVFFSTDAIGGPAKQRADKAGAHSIYKTDVVGLFKKIEELSKTESAS